jgi:hypothetical protein
VYSLVQAITRLGEARAKAAEEAQIPNLERFQAGNYVMISTFAKVAIYQQCITFLNPVETRQDFAPVCILLEDTRQL